jgi:signal transduction histidine kinase
VFIAVLPTQRATGRRQERAGRPDLYRVGRASACVGYLTHRSIKALTNAAKHAHASLVQVSGETSGQVLHLHVRDDGTGEADPARGSGLIGLRDRVEALGGTITVHSPAGAGTSLHAKLPLSD